MDVQINHVYRDANGLADFLASHAVQIKCSIDFLGSGVLPMPGKLVLH